MNRPLHARAGALGGALEEVMVSLRGRSARCEAERRVPAETVEDIHASGLLNVLAPRAFGGAELGFGAAVRTTAALSSACGSTGWVFGVFAGHRWILGLFPEEAQAELFADPRTLISSVFHLTAQVVPAPGGFLMTGGQGRFCSGIDHADWVLVGSAVERGEGPPEPRFFLLPKAEVEIADDWFTVGMRGTGSRSIRIPHAFIPEHRSCRTADMMRGEAPGASLHAASALFSVPFVVGGQFALVGAPLGMAMGALDILTKATAAKMATLPPAAVSEQGALFQRIAAAAADIDASFATVLARADQLDSAPVPSALDALEKARIRRDLAYAVQKCRYAVTSLMEAGGGSHIYDASDLQRVWRDLNAAAAHISFNWDIAATEFGRAQLGLPPRTPPA